MRPLLLALLLVASPARALFDPPPQVADEDVVAYTLGTALLTVSSTAVVELGRDASVGPAVRFGLLQGLPVQGDVSLFPFQGREVPVAGGLRLYPFGLHPQRGWQVGGSFGHSFGTAFGMDEFGLSYGLAWQWVHGRGMLVQVEALHRQVDSLGLAPANQNLLQLSLGFVPAAALCHSGVCE